MTGEREALNPLSPIAGLTRWQFIFGEVEVDGDKEFGDLYATAIDETWYKSAIIQHHIDKNSFVYSVPHEGDEDDEAEIKVTASMAIFPRDGGLEAPSCVVGFQFSHSLMYERFMEITSTIEVSDRSSNKLNRFWLIISLSSAMTARSHAAAMSSFVT
jgi:hypothetical protein